MVVRYGNPRGNDREGWTWDVYCRVPGAGHTWAVIGCEIRKKKNYSPTYHRKLWGFIPHREDPEWWSTDIDAEFDGPNTPNKFYEANKDPGSWRLCNPDGSRKETEEPTDS